MAADDLRPGVPTTVYVSTGADDDTTPPLVRAEGATVRSSSRDGEGGVWPFVVVPEPLSRTVELAVEGTGDRTTLPVVRPTPGSARIPERYEGVARSGTVRIPLEADPDDIPWLDVVAAEGEVSVVTEDDDAWIELVPSTSPFPRVIPIGVRDRRGRDAPSWGLVRLKARPRIPFRAEPNAVIVVEVGGRKYGPVTADENGNVEIRIDQYPGERAARAVLEDDLGNTTSSTIPLAGEERPALLGIEGPRPDATRPPESLFLWGVDALGHDSGSVPTCRSPARGALPVVPLAAGGHLVPIADTTTPAGGQLRIDCSAQGVDLGLRLGGIEGVPARLGLQVWPTQLSTDFPVAEVRVTVEDALGGRLASEPVEVTADLGKVEMDGGLGEYTGDAAVEAGGDRIRATLRREAVENPVATLALSWAAPGAQLRMRALAEDREGRPVRNAPVTLGAGADTVETMTDDEGWAAADVPVPPGTSPLLLIAKTRFARVRELVSRSSSRPEAVDSRTLMVERELALAPGRVRSVKMRFDPPVLSTGRNAVAWVRVELLDQAGHPVLDEPVEITASEGQVGSLFARADGTWVAEFSPARGERAREVEITATSRGISTTGTLPLEPRLGRLSIGPTIGWITNLGALSSPTVAIDADFRLRVLNGSVMLRAGAMVYGLRGSAETGFGEDATLRSTLVPGNIALLIRQDRGGFGIWGGAGGMLGVQTVKAAFGQDVVADGLRSISGGVLLAGAGYRLGGGDLVTEVRYTWLPGTGGELGFTGNLGGLTGIFGYRLVY